MRYECENILALNQPVATDLRFVISCLKMSNDLERIGDNVKQIAKLLITNKKIFNEEAVRKFKLLKMFDVAIEMGQGMAKAFKKNDSKAVKKIMKMDEDLDKINGKAIEVASEIISERPKHVSEVIQMYTIINKLERVGDLTKNVGEEIVFHVEAKVIKHKKNKDKKDKDNDKE